ncbi:hypothetical protein Tco_0016365 [Tanacetum coccineum]
MGCFRGGPLEETDPHDEELPAPAASTPSTQAIADPTYHLKRRLPPTPPSPTLYVTTNGVQDLLALGSWLLGILEASLNLLLMLGNG